MIELEPLKHLQGIDGELFKLRRRQQQMPRELERVEARRAAQQERVQAADERLKALQVSQKEQEMDLQSREERIKKLKTQLFQLKTNKDYTLMQQEIDALKADNSLLEEGIIRLLDAVDRPAMHRQRQPARWAHAELAVARERQRLEGELAVISRRMAQLADDRQTVLPGVPAQTLATYERVLALREGLALVPIVVDACGGCDRRLTSQVINQVYLRETLMACEHCNRILYFDEAHSRL
jgi:predicted  nucleic acid-binding Zn-ribbon protein